MLPLHLDGPRYTTDTFLVEVIISCSNLYIIVMREICLKYYCRKHFDRVKVKGQILRYRPDKIFTPAVRPAVHVLAQLDAMGENNTCFWTI